MCRKWLCKVLKCCDIQQGIDPPKYLSDISWSEVNTILKAEFPDASILMTDAKYKTTTKVEFIRFITYDISDKYNYVSDYYDCDDYSFSIYGNISNPEWGALTFGVIWTNTPTGAHAVNCFIDNDREVWIVEPQTDEVFKLPDNWKPYLIIM